MDIAGIGIDMESIARFREKEYRKNKKFYSIIFSSAEIAYCRNKADPAVSFTGLFCAKEAVAKALRHDNIFSISSIEIFHDKAGAPYVRVNKNECSCFVSISHSDTNAIAFAVAYQ